MILLAPSPGILEPFNDPRRYGMPLPEAYYQRVFYARRIRATGRPHAPRIAAAAEAEAAKLLILIAERSDAHA